MDTTACLTLEDHYDGLWKMLREEAALELGESVRDPLIFITYVSSRVSLSV